MAGNAIRWQQCTIIALAHAHSALNKVAPEIEGNSFTRLGRFGPMVKDFAEQQRQGQHAVFQFTHAAQVILIDGRIGWESDKAGNGSATVLATPGGKLILLTARHVLEDRPPKDGFTIGHWSHPNGIAEAVGRHWSHPMADVAIALLNSDAAAALRDCALETDVVESSKDSQFHDDDVPILCGCPFKYRTPKRVDATERKVSFGFTPISYFTILDGIDTREGHERFKVYWDDGIIPDCHMQTDPQVKLTLNEVFKLAHPGGISGGPLFRLHTKTPKNEVWSAAKHARIVGVASTYLDDREYCPSTSVWADWFFATVREID